MIGSILLVIIVLSFLIIIHELGHFFAARKAGIWVEEFGIGYPPRAFGKKIKETIYSINFLPFGGFVRLHGEGSEEGVTKPDRAFVNKSARARAFVVTAGVIMNVLFAIVCFSFVYSVTGIPRESDKVEILEVAENSPAAIQGILPQDVVVSINNESIYSIEDFQDKVGKSLDEESTLVIEREVDGAIVKQDVLVIPRSSPPEDQGALGVVITTTEIYFPPLWQRPFYGAYYGGKEAIFWSGAIIGGFISIFRNLFAGHVPTDIAGPVGIFAITSKAASFGYISLINFVGILSLNLAILNILPFPALDGGRLLFIIVESLFGRKVLPKVEAYAHMAGMIVLLLLVFAITFYDIKRIVEAGGVNEFLDSLIMQSLAP